MGAGLIDWEVLGASTQSCALVLNGTREFVSAPAQIPPGEYVATFRCGEAFGWERNVQIRRGQRLRLLTSPQVEGEVGITPDKTTLYQWPKGSEFLNLYAQLVGINVASLSPRAHPSGQGIILVVERVGPQGDRKTLGWAEVPKSTLGAATSALVLGSAPVTPVPKQTRPLSPWAIGAYSTGAVFLIGGVVTNLLHNADTSGPSTVDQVNENSDARMTSLALYGVGGTELISGLILQLLSSSPPSTVDGLAGTEQSSDDERHALSLGDY